MQQIKKRSSFEKQRTCTQISTVKSKKTIDRTKNAVYTYLVDTNSNKYAE